MTDEEKKIYREKSRKNAYLKKHGNLDGFKEK